jgi:site-specific DNA recombinase
MPSPVPASSYPGSFDSWLEAPVTVRRRGRSADLRPEAGGLRFAFYGRISTVEYQDPVSSRAWQIEAAGRGVAGRGRIVAEFFDVGTSRSLPWPRRPQAAALLAAAQDPDRGFDAVVVGSSSGRSPAVTPRW